MIRPPSDFLSAKTLLVAFYIRVSLETEFRELPLNCLLEHNFTFGIPDIFSLLCFFFFLLLSIFFRLLQPVNRLSLCALGDNGCFFFSF